MPNYPIVFQARDHRHIRTIVVMADRKIRRSVTLDNPTGAPLTDEWPVLYRRDVPSLTDEEWTASPGPEWTETKGDQ